MFFGRVPMGTNCASLLAELFLYWCEADFIQWRLKEKQNEASPIRNASLLTGHRCQFRGVSQDMKQT
jgi:hypothetical protein